MSARRALGVAQTTPVPGDVEANLEQHLRLVRRAAPHRPDVLLFPELSLTGYELHDAARLAMSEDDSRLASLRDAARRFEVTLVVGAPVRRGDRLHLGAFVCTPAGRVATYTKQRLGAFGAADNPGGPIPPAERTVFVPGDLDPLVRLAHDHAAIAICADVGDPAHADHAARRGASVYLASMFVVPRALPADRDRLTQYAARHRMAVVFANYGSGSGGMPAAGGSTIWSPAAEELVTLPRSGAGVAVACQEHDGWAAHALPCR
ncbi:MAG: carbon-nitrogen hydrolase family protein [Myxococcota bacterium]